MTIRVPYKFDFALLHYNVVFVAFMRF